MINIAQRVNRAMQPLKAYIEQGEQTEGVANVLQVLNQLEDDELAYIMAKYVTLAEYHATRTIKQPSTKQIGNHLNLKPKELNDLQYRVNNKIYELLYDEENRRWEKEFDRKKNERETAFKAHELAIDEWYIQVFSKAGYDVNHDNLEEVKVEAIRNYKNKRGNNYDQIN